MHSLPSELEASIGTSTLFAAWNAATYVGQIDEQRLEEAMKSVDYYQLPKKLSKSMVVFGLTMNHILFQGKMINHLPAE